MTARRADLVWEVALAGVRGLRHVELQVKVEADIGERVAEYALRLWRRDHLPVVSVVIFLRPVGHVPEPRFVLPSLGHDRLVDTFTIVRLWEVPQERVLESPEYLLWPLAALLAWTSVETTIAVGERIAATARRWKSAGS